MKDSIYKKYCEQKLPHDFQKRAEGFASMSNTVQEEMFRAGFYCGMHINDVFPDPDREQNAAYYHAKESDCPDSFKFLMLLNGWHNPFVALNELLKVIYTNEMLLKRNGMKKGYKSRYREMEKLVQEHSTAKEVKK